MLPQPAALPAATGRACRWKGSLNEPLGPRREKSKRRRRAAGEAAAAEQAASSQRPLQQHPEGRRTSLPLRRSRLGTRRGSGRAGPRSAARPAPALTWRLQKPTRHRPERSARSAGTALRLAFSHSSFILTQNRPHERRGRGTLLPWQPRHPGRHPPPLRSRSGRSPPCRRPLPPGPDRPDQARPGQAAAGPRAPPRGGDWPRGTGRARGAQGTPRC